MFLIACYKMNVSEKYLTTKEASELLSVKQVTVRSWCDKGLLRTARKENSPRGDYWIISERELKNFEPPMKGRKPLDNPSKTALAKRRQRRQEKDLIT